MTRLPKITAVSFAFIVSLFTLVLLQAKASAQADQATLVDPPSRVARLSYLSGDVSFQPNGVDDWVAATLNRPLTTSDHLWTARGARAELHIGNAALRLDGETSFTLANLNDQRVQMQVAQGVLNIRLRRLYENEIFEIDTPNLTLTLLREGEYAVRIDNENDASWVTVRTGTAEVTAGGQALTVRPGQEAKFSGADGGSFEVNAAPGRGGFDQWCSARDQREDNVRSAQYVSRDVIGYEDLDAYGNWQNYEGYGPVWVPVVSPGWAPYRYGHWTWVYPWGWTWVDDAPWGFAPFHYGRWMNTGYGWAWVPGPIVARPVYAPAMVAWIGGGGGIGLAFGGGYGWIPLGPREPFIPWYWGSRGYFSRVNVTNTRITSIHVTNYYNNYYAPHYLGRRDDHRSYNDIDYANRRVQNGATFVDHDSFVNGRSVSSSAMHVPLDKVRNTPMVTNIDATPDRRSALGGHDQNAAFRPPQKAFERPVLSRAVAPKPLPFDAQAKSFRTPGAAGGTIDNHQRISVGFDDGLRQKGGSNIPAGAGNSNSRRTISMPPEQRGTQTTTSASKPRWTVPKPANDNRAAGDDTARERQGSSTGAQSRVGRVTPRTEQSNANRPAANTRERANPVAAPQARESTRAPELERRAERAPEAHQSAARVEHSNPQQGKSEARGAERGGSERR